MINPSDFLHFASSIRNEDNEAASRCCVHTAYYALYHSALNLAKSKGFELKENEPVHKQVRLCFENSKDKRLVKLAKRLKTTFSFRVIADYELDEDLKKSDVAAHLYSCQLGINDIAFIKKSSDVA